MVFCYESLSRLRPYDDFRLVLEKLPLYVSYLLCFHVNSLQSGGTCAFSLYPQALVHSLKLSGYTTFVELDKTEFTYLFCYILLLLFSCSVVSNSLRPHGLQHARCPCPSLSPRVSLNFMSIESVMLFNHLILSSPSPPAFSLSQHRVFSNELAFHIRWPKCWSFSFSISSSNEYSGLISFRIDWYDLLAIQGTLKSLLQHHKDT